MQKLTLGLSMIVKDEIHVLQRLLDSVSPVIDYWAIVDTGSVDGSQQFIKNYFLEKDIPGELIEIEWKDFATSRNVALAAVEEHCDYGIWIDSDEELIVEPTFNKQKTLSGNFDSISIRTNYGRVDYTRKNIWKTKYGFYWNGPVHELLSSPKEATGAIAEGIYVIVRPEGNSWKDVRKKYLEHAAILEKWTEVDKDPRWVFYTAQSFRDASEHEKAIEWYKKRATINDGFLEEIFISRYMVAGLSEAIGKDKATVTQLFQEAHASDPLRGESIKGLIKTYQKRGDWENAYVFSMYGLRYNKNNPYPSRILFIEKTLYDFEMLELHSLSCYYTKRNEEGSRAYWMMRAQLDALGKDYLPQEIMQKVIDNEKYFPKVKINIPRLDPKGTNITKAKKARKKVK